MMVVKIPVFWVSRTRRTLRPFTFAHMVNFSFAAGVFKGLRARGSLGCIWCSISTGCFGVYVGSRTWPARYWLATRHGILVVFSWNFIFIYGYLRPSHFMCKFSHFEFYFIHGSLYIVIYGDFNYFQSYFISAFYMGYSFRFYFYLGSF